MTEIIITCDAWLTGSGAQVAFGAAQGCYEGRRDLIHLRDRDSFRDTGASSLVEPFYTTAFRGLGHCATARGRLNRDLAVRFGDGAPAAGHPVAELFAAFACARFGVRSAPSPDLARHAASWRGLLVCDRSALYDGAALASAALQPVRSGNPALVGDGLP